jgi:predicted ArsR family transcriptional regulator
MQKEKVLSTLEEIKVISDPFRFKILVLFNKESGSLTVKQMAVKLKEVPSKVHYHVKELERIGVLEIVETKEKGGIIEKFYLPTAEMFKVKKDIGVIDESYEQAGENLISIMHEDFMESMKNKIAGDKKQLNYGLTYLTDEEVEQLGELILEFMKDKEQREKAKPYMFGYALFRKYDNEGDMGDGSES